MLQSQKEAAIKPQINTNVESFLLVFLFFLLTTFTKVSLANNFHHVEQILSVK